MAKKSFLERLKLVESQEEFNQEEVLFTLQEQFKEISLEQTPEINFEVGEEVLNVTDIYEKAGLADLSRSIFKVDEFGKHLPDNLPSDVKRQSVIGILTASGLELSTLLDDAQLRIEALKGVANSTIENSNNSIMEMEEEITILLNKVDELKQEIINKQSAQEQQNNLINVELDSIGQILKFINK